MLIIQQNDDTFELEIFFLAMLSRWW
jgi:hypothetical protein